MLGHQHTPGKVRTSQERIKVPRGQSPQERNDPTKGNGSQESHGGKKAYFYTSSNILVLCLFSWSRSPKTESWWLEVWAR